MKIILEYSEKQNCFHINTGDKEENTCGYNTIKKDIDSSFADRFIKIIRKKTKGFPMKIEYIKSEFKKFIKD
jgi:plasmid replication initiation protein